MLALYRALLRLRREERALRPGDADVDVEHDESAGWIRMTLRPNAGTGTALVALFNLSTEPRELALAGSSRAIGTARRILATDEPRFMPGSRAQTGEQLTVNEKTTVAPMSAALFTFVHAEGH